MNDSWNCWKYLEKNLNPIFVEKEKKKKEENYNKIEQNKLTADWKIKEEKKNKIHIHIRDGKACEKRR